MGAPHEYPIRTSSIGVAVLNQQITPPNSSNRKIIRFPFCQIVFFSYLCRRISYTYQKNSLYNNENHQICYNGFRLGGYLHLVRTAQPI